MLQGAFESLQLSHYDGLAQTHTNMVYGSERSDVDPTMYKAMYTTLCRLVDLVC
eukprot:SAG31_NODE_20483_length_573_cov_0.888186_1_plen_53_part_01